MYRNQKKVILKYRFWFLKYLREDFGLVLVPKCSKGFGSRTSSFRYDSNPWTIKYNNWFSKLNITHQRARRNFISKIIIVFLLFPIVAKLHLRSRYFSNRLKCVRVQYNIVRNTKIGTPYFGCIYYLFFLVVVFFHVIILSFLLKTIMIPCKHFRYIVFFYIILQNMFFFFYVFYRLFE